MRREPGRTRASRRRFMAATVGALAAPAVAPATRATRASQEPRTPTELDVQTLRIAQTVSAMPQSDEALAKALPLVNRYRGHIERLRTVDVPAPVDPAFSFHPRRSPRPKAKAAPSGTPRRAAPRRVPPPASEADLAFATVSELHAWLVAGQVSSEQLTRLALNRLRTHDATLSCVVTLADERAMDEAKRADADRRARAAGPWLRGIPYGAKDIFDSAHIRTQWGARPYLDRPVPKDDSTAIARLAAEGACLAAKLSTGELAIGDTWSGEPAFQDGRPLRDAARGIQGQKTRNPWDPKSGAGGSSAGPASAVAAGLVPFALATETGGSIVSPASACGVAGLRPTYGRVSRRGVMTLRWTLDKVGVIARSVADCGLVLLAIHGPDGEDGTVSDAPLDWNPDRARPARRLRLGLIESELFEADPGASEKERAEAALLRPIHEAAVEFYRKAGFELVKVALPAFPASALYAIHNAEAGAMFDDITRNGAIDTLEGQGPNDRSSQLRAARFIPAVDYIRAQRIRTLMIAAMERLFENVDLLLSPPSSASVNMTNLTGHPALVLPAGFVRGDTGLEMPRSIMLTGRLDDEAALLDAGLAFERGTPWRQRRPPQFA